MAADNASFIEGWHDFFVAEAGASAALAFVAISINVASIVLLIEIRS